MDRRNRFSEWQPGQYLRFQEERTQPSIDLARRIPLANPGRIMDLGCGPGNSTAVLADLWPKAELIGVDTSEAMLEKAVKTPVRARWVRRDASEDMTDLGSFDIIFSNAALQWIPDTERLLRRLHAMLNPGGVLAVQVPYNPDLPAFAAIGRIRSRPEWKDHLAGAADSMHYHGYAFYYDELSRLAGALSLWQTTYIHVMDSHAAIVEWYKGTGLRPYLRLLPDETLTRRFLSQYTDAIAAVYPVARDGNVLFPFNRVFFLKHKPVE